MSVACYISSELFTFHYTACIHILYVSICHPVLTRRNKQDEYLWTIYNGQGLLCTVPATYWLKKGQHLDRELDDLYKQEQVPNLVVFTTIHSKSSGLIKLLAIHWMIGWLQFNSVATKHRMAWSFKRWLWKSLLTLTSWPNQLTPILASLL